VSQPALSSITVAGFKSIGTPQTIEIAPLTILAGANNSGKSSIMQPLLLLKQTLLSTVDPRGLKQQGPLVSLAAGELWHFDRRTGTVPGMDLDFTFSADATATLCVGPNMGRVDFTHVSFKTRSESFEYPNPQGNGSEVVLDRFFPRTGDRHSNRPPVMEDFATILQRTIHLPPVRRLEPSDGPAVLPATLEDRFDSYVASILQYWQESAPASVAFERVQKDMQFLGVSVGVSLHLPAYQQIEVSVFPERTTYTTRPSNVGFGITQALPIVVGLLFAEPGDLVHVEEPEAHLHPRAQVELTRLIAEAANRGVRVVIETHSALMLREVQTLVARGAIAPSDVRLHWFQRDAESFETRVTSATIDEQGTFGDWPEDFDEVNLDSEKRFLDATFSRSRR